MSHVLSFRNWNRLYESGVQAKPKIVPIPQTGVSLVIFSAPGQGWQAPDQKPYVQLGQGDVTFTGAASNGKTVMLTYKPSNDKQQGAWRSVNGPGESGNYVPEIQTNAPNLVEGTNLMYTTAEALYGIGNVDFKAVGNTLATLFYIKTNYPTLIENVPLVKSMMGIGGEIYNLGGNYNSAWAAFKLSKKNTAKASAPKTFPVVWEGVTDGYKTWRAMKG